MVINLDGMSTYNTGAAGASSHVVTVPTGNVDGNLLLAAITVGSATVPTTPTGWTIWQTGSTTAHALGVYYRVAAAEPASYTFTTASSRVCISMATLSGVDTTTPKDVAVPAVGTGTTTYAFPAITPVTAGAWVWATGSVGFASGATTGTPAASNFTLDAVVGPTAQSASINTAQGTGHLAWSAGAFTPAMTTSVASARTVSMTSAIRPAAGGVAPAGRVQHMSRWR